MYRRFKKKKKSPKFRGNEILFVEKRIEKISKMNIQYNLLASKQRNR